MDRRSRHGKQTADQDGIVILWKVRERSGRVKGRSEHTHPRARLPYLAHNLDTVVRIVKDVKTQVRVRSTPPRDSLGGSGLGGTTVDMKSYCNELLDYQ